MKRARISVMGASVAAASREKWMALPKSMVWWESRTVIGGESAAAGGAPADRARSAAAMAAMAARVEGIRFYRPATSTAVSGLGPGFDKYLS